VSQAVLEQDSVELRVLLRMEQVMVLKISGIWLGECP
jgi:hypothetical protein